MTSNSKMRADQHLSLEEEYNRQKATVDHVRSLLTKADEKRLSEPDNVRRWNKVLDNLESALDEAKARLAVLESRMNQAKLQVPSSSGNTHSEGNLHKPAAAVSSDVPVTEPDAAALAAKSLLEAPLESVESAPLEQVVLARNYLNERNRSGKANGEEKRLAGRIELALQARDRTQAAPAISGSVQERRQQQVMRLVIGKIVANRMDALTFSELEFVVSSYYVLTQRAELLPTEQRLLAVLSKAVAEIERLAGEIPSRQV